MAWTFSIASAREFPNETNYQLIVDFIAGVCPVVDDWGLPRFSLSGNAREGWNLVFYFQDLDIGDGMLHWDTGIPVTPGLADDLNIYCDVAGVRSRPGTQTVTIRKGGGGGPGTPLVKPKISSAGKKAGIRDRKGKKWKPMRKQNRFRRPL